ncbi:complement regulator-acquiring protein (plasmid) [Borrelia hermsii]|uniref:complement regulator-acquiring protein n=1 Tax=Borrelia hermsii TaxID=140 RepID=UPI001CF51194|nr:complement regulator-acquiring protein [Borrelia hermsii]UCP01906.1 complement regulator-acquiring protein [Borrelia hermsii]
MRNNILNNIFVTFALTVFTLVGCNPKGSDLTALQDTQSDNATTQHITLSPQLAVSNVKLEGKKGNLIPKPELKPENPNDKQNLAQNALEKAQGVKSEKDKEEDKAPLIAWITNKAKTDTDLVNKYNNNIEDADQYGMKQGVFQYLRNSANQKTANSVENTQLRKQLYSSLDWSGDKIRKFGTILNTIKRNDTNNLAKTILLTGINYAQGHFEWIISITYDKTKHLNKLTLQELKNIKSKLQEIDKLRQKWIDTTNNIITDHEANANGIQKDNQKLLKHVNSQYGWIFKDEIPKIQVLAKDIEKILK